MLDSACEIEREREKRARPPKSGGLEDRETVTFRMGVEEEGRRGCQANEHFQFPVNRRKIVLLSDFRGEFCQVLPPHSARNEG